MNKIKSWKPFTIGLCIMIAVFIFAFSFGTKERQQKQQNNIDNNTSNIQTNNNLNNNVDEENPQNNFKLINDKIIYINGNKYVSGQIKNISNQSLDSTVYINLYDNNNQQVDSISDVMNNFEPNTIWNFKANIPDYDTTATNYKIVKISSIN